MRRSIRLITVLIAAVALALAAAACGQEKISIPKSDPDYSADVQAASVFHERCGGCHTLSYAATNGSGNNPRTYLDISGPNFNVRCERPVDRVLYAIENGGFGGAYMPQNIVVGKQAREVAMFVARFAGRQASVQPDTVPCTKQSIGTLAALPTSTDPDLSAETTTKTTGTEETTTPVQGSGDVNSKGKQSIGSQTNTVAHVSAGDKKNQSQSNPSPGNGQ